MNSSTSEPVQLTIAGCNELCPIDDFIRHISKMSITPEEWEEKCQSFDVD